MILTDMWIENYAQLIVHNNTHNPLELSSCLFSQKWLWTGTNRIDYRHNDQNRKHGY